MLPVSIVQVAISRPSLHHAAFYAISAVAVRLVHKFVHNLVAGAGDFPAIELSDEARLPDETVDGRCRFSAPPLTTEEI